MILLRCYTSRCGGIGRRTGLKIPGSQERTGSTPVTGTTSKQGRRSMWQHKHRHIDRRPCFSFSVANPLRWALRRYWSGFGLPRCTTSEFAPHGSKKAIAKQLPFSHLCSAAPPFLPRPADAGLTSDCGIGSGLDCSGAPERDSPIRDCPFLHENEGGEPEGTWQDAASVEYQYVLNMNYTEIRIGRAVIVDNSFVCIIGLNLKAFVQRGGPDE